MKRFVVFVFLTSVTPLWSEENPNDDSVWLRDGVHLASSRFVQTTIAPHPDDKAISAINHESEHEWWGRLKVVYRIGDKVDWVAELPEVYLQGRGHHVLSVRWVFLSKLNLWAMETFESTHMGNGSMWLLTLEGQKLRVLMQAAAVDRHWGDGEGEVFRGGKLAVEYLGGDPDKPAAVKLHGIIDTLGNDNNITSSRHVSELWLWDDAGKVFVKKDEGA